MYEGFVYVIYQDDGNWCITQITATVRLDTVKEWIRMTFGEFLTDGRMAFWMDEVRRMPLNGELTIEDGGDYLHIRKVNPERE